MVPDIKPWGAGVARSSSLCFALTEYPRDATITAEHAFWYRCYYFEFGGIFYCPPPLHFLCLQIVYPLGRIE